MTFELKILSKFEKNYKRLAKKYPSLKSDLKKVLTELRTNPKMGVPIGNDCFKIRMAISSKQKGKSGGARNVSHFYISKKYIYLLTIYDKSEKATLTNKELFELLSIIPKDKEQ